MFCWDINLRSSAILDHMSLHAPRILAPADASKHVPRTALTIEWARVANARRIHLELEPDAAPPAVAPTARSSPSICREVPPQCRFRMSRSQQSEVRR